MDSEILEILKSMQSDMKTMQGDIKSMKSDMNDMQSDIKDLKKGQNEANTRLMGIDKKLDAIYYHTAELTEFRTETRDGFKGIGEDLNNLELITAKNYSDIVKLKAVK